MQRTDHVQQDEVMEEDEGVEVQEPRRVVGRVDLVRQSGIEIREREVGIHHLEASVKRLGKSLRNNCYDPRMQGTRASCRAGEGNMP